MSTTRSIHHSEPKTRSSQEEPETPRYSGIQPEPETSSDSLSKPESEAITIEDPIPLSHGKTLVSGYHNKRLSREIRFHFVSGYRKTPENTNLTRVPDEMVTRVPMGVSGKGDHAHEFALPGFEYKFTPLTGVSDGLLNWLTEENFIVNEMATVSAHHLTESTGWHAITHLETLIGALVAECERLMGKRLLCAWVVAAGASGRKGAEAHMVFKNHPDMKRLKRLCRKMGGNIRVTGNYDKLEDWTEMSLDDKNSPPHDGCLHYFAKHASYPEIVINANGLKLPADLLVQREPEPPVAPQQPQPELPRLESTQESDAAWLAENVRSEADRFRELHELKKKYRYCGF